MNTDTPEKPSSSVKGFVSTLTDEERAKVRQMKLWTFFLYVFKGNVYNGTVPRSVVRKRRARNKVARRSRRINRKG